VEVVAALEDLEILVLVGQVDLEVEVDHQQ
jgi:hypothetical protein